LVGVSFAIVIVADAGMDSSNGQVFKFSDP
jgi:hypothetical protein